ncbi:MAG: ribosomal protein, partial [Planctomycetota bacterium]
GIDRTCLVATDGANKNAILSARNLDGVDVCRIDQLNVFALLNHRFLVVDKAALVSFLNETCFGSDESAPAAAPAAKPGSKSKSKKEVA